MDHVDTLVIGAGVVGLAIARTLAQSGRDVLIAERERQIGSGISSRNSEVIHAGIYYAPHSLKARLCVEGRQRLYDYCAARGVEARRCGKLIVGTGAEQERALATIAATARSNGVDDLEQLDAVAVGALEPQVSCTAALLSPSTGIVDSHGLMMALLADAEENGATLALNSPVDRIRPVPAGYEISLHGEPEPVLITREVINAAGLDSWAVAAGIVGLPAGALPPRHLAKGSYFALAGRSPFRRLVYPVPEPGGLGVHATLDLDGRVRFGPDVEWCDGVDFTVDPRRAERFYAAIRTYWPALQDNALVPAYAGVRPKLSGPGDAAADFRIDDVRQHGMPNLVNLFGIESPGLTASLALAQELRARLD